MDLTGPCLRLHPLPLLPEENVNSTAPPLSLPCVRSSSTPLALCVLCSNLPGSLKLPEPEHCSFAPCLDSVFPRPGNSSSHLSSELSAGLAYSQPLPHLPQADSQWLQWPLVPCGGPWHPVAQLPVSAVLSPPPGRCLGEVRATFCLWPCPCTCPQHRTRRRHSASIG